MFNPTYRIKNYFKNINMFNVCVLMFICICMVSYYMYYALTGIGIKCQLYERTGLYCCGCGFTRMVTYLLHFDIINAIRCNILGVLSLPMSVIFASRFITDRDIGTMRLCIVIFFVCVLFTLLRNIECFWFLRPA